MSSEKGSVSEDCRATDYSNMAFINPYAISTDDLTLTTFGDHPKAEPTNDGKAMVNGGFEPTGTFVENNPHYEDAVEVAKKAGLNSTGRRRKENIVYETAGYKKRPKSEKRPEPPQRSSNLSIPQRPIEDSRGTSKLNNRSWILPFTILCILVVVCLIGAAFGVLAYFDEKECSCTNNGPQTERATGSNDSRVDDLQDTYLKLSKKIEDIMVRFDKLTALEGQQTKHEGEFTQFKGSVNTTHQELEKAIHTINATLNIELKSVKSNVASLSNDLYKFNSELRSVSNFTQKLNDTVEDIKTAFTIQLRNVSKQMGPRGFNGSQGAAGPQGAQGVGNISACTVKEKRNRNEITGDKELVKVVVSHDQHAGWKVMSAVCASGQRAGAIHSILSVDGNKYTCTCAGPSIYSVFKQVRDGNSKEFMECIIIIWECPELT